MSASTPQGSRGSGRRSGAYREIALRPRGDELNDVPDRGDHLLGVKGGLEMIRSKGTKVELPASSRARSTKVHGVA